MRRALTTAAALALLVPAGAQASAGGLTANFGGEGATRPGALHTYVTLARGKSSLLQAINRDNGAADRSRLLPGLFGAPQVTRDGAKTGLSWDEKTLVLADVPHVYPVRETHLLVLDARRLKILQRIDLKGWYSVAALAPGGETIYLVHYLRDQATFEVVAYDRADAARTVIEAEMSGTPLSRVTSADGRFEFTLYDNLGAPYIHSLDTQGKAGRRIALPQLEGRDLSLGTLRLAGGTVQIGDLATLDPETAVVTLTPRQPAAATPREDGPSPWPFVALGLIAIGAVAFLGAWRRSAQGVEDLEVIVHHADEHSSGTL